MLDTLKSPDCPRGPQTTRGPPIKPPEPSKESVASVGEIGGIIVGVVIIALLVTLVVLLVVVMIRKWRPSFLNRSAMIDARLNFRTIDCNLVYLKLIVYACSKHGHVSQ